MKKITKNGITCFQFHQIEGFSEDMDHAVFSRTGGVSLAPYSSLNVAFNVGDNETAVRENRLRIMKAMRIKKAVSGQQTHSTNVLVIDEAMSGVLFADGVLKAEVSDTDGFVTNQPGVGLMIRVADCQAILFYDPGMKILGMAHAGWRGLKSNISKVVIEEMVKLGSKPGQILVGISPSLGPENSEFTDPLRELGPEFAPYIKKRKVDLWEFSRQQLMKSGIEERKIELARIDTADIETGSRFYSHRREGGKTGRFAMVAYIR